MKCLTTLTKINAFTTNTYENLKNYIYYGLSWSPTSLDETSNDRLLTTDS